MLFLALFIALSLAFSPPTLAVEQKELDAMITGYLSDQIRQAYKGADYSIKTHEVHPALAAKPCAAARYTTTQKRLFGRVSIRVNCSEPSWAFYTTAEVEIQVPTVVARDLIAKNSLITPDLVKVESRALNMTTGFTRVSAVDGMVARNAIRAGQPLFARHLKTPWAIKSGQRVIIRAVIGQAEISTQGIALENGHVGDQIRVRNLKSKKSVPVWVWDNGDVGTRPRQKNPERA